jgi:SAM-dependent methyltransferase
MHWRWEIFRRACDPLDVRKWKRDSSVALWSLLGKPGARLLDSTCGLGDHSINLRDVGFDVEACDASAFVLEEAARNIRDAGVEVPLFACRWQDLGKRSARYDVVFNDVIHWIHDPNELREAAAGLRDALVPGGSLVFFFADGREPEAGAGKKILEWDWENMARTELAWEHEKDGTRVSLGLMNERGDDFIDQHHFYVVRERDAVRLESFTMRRVYRWDFHALSRALADVGFRDITSHAFENVKGHGYALNLARR